MNGWRARIGLVKPTHRGKAMAFWYQRAPEGVECVAMTIGFRQGTKETFTDDAVFRRAEELAADLRSVGCDIVTVSGSPPFLLRGHEHEERWRADLEDRIGIPVVSGMRPHALALKELGIKRVAVATYYGNELNDAIIRYFAAFGVEARVIPGFQLSSQNEGLYSTPLMALDAASYDQVYQHCKKGMQQLDGKFDGLYINGGGWDAQPAIKYLEQDLGIPVVWAMATEMWLTYRTLQLGDPIDDCGVLLSDPEHRRLP